MADDVAIIRSQLMIEQLLLLAIPVCFWVSIEGAVLIGLMLMIMQIALAPATLANLIDFYEGDTNGK